LAHAWVSRGRGCRADTRAARCSAFPPQKSSPDAAPGDASASASAHAVVLASAAALMGRWTAPSAPEWPKACTAKEENGSTGPWRKGPGRGTSCAQRDGAEPSSHDDDGK